MSGRAAQPPGDLTKRVAAVLRGRKAELDLKDEQIAVAIGVSQEQVSRFLKPSRVMTIEQMEKICEFLGLDVAHALNGERRLIDAPKGDDLRTLIAFLIAHPAQDEELNTRLSEAVSRSGLRGSNLATLQETIRDVRRQELEEALRALPPSAAQGGTRTG